MRIILSVSHLLRNKVKTIGEANINQSLICYEKFHKLVTIKPKN
jgi:hypothetical protein